MWQTNVKTQTTRDPYKKPIFQTYVMHVDAVKAFYVFVRQGNEKICQYYEAPDNFLCENISLPAVR